LYIVEDWYQLSLSKPTPLLGEDGKIYTIRESMRKSTKRKACDSPDMDSGTALNPNDAQVKESDSVIIGTNKSGSEPEPEPESNPPLSFSIEHVSEGYGNENVQELERYYWRTIFYEKPMYGGEIKAS
jgi:hypothetical protein